jgi:hypothetical protein
MTTPNLARNCLRAAVKIHERLMVPCWTTYLDCWPSHEWERLRNLLWRLRKVQSRGWQAAARDVLTSVQFETLLLVDKLKAFRKQLPPLHSQSHLLTPSQIAADLAALENEFESVQIDLKARTVTVRTDPIELEGLWLGPFDIRLWWERIGVRRPYEVIATSPQRPNVDEEVTHPHVRDNLLCEGEATVSIKSALAGGRVFDFFLLVRQTLQTYNSASPYVAIEEWEGARCGDCGLSMHGDDASSCDACDARICNDCSLYCRDCDRYACSECSGQCAECENTFCQTCLADPPEAERRLCAGCRKLQVAEEPDDAEASDDTSLAADAVCVGEVAAAA